MIACSSCGSTNAPHLRACAKCGGLLSGAPRSPLAVAAEDGRILREARGQARLRSLRRMHAGVGAATFFLLNLLLGLPGSLLPGALAANAVGSSLFGLPIGYLISRGRAGPYKGALISAGVFIVVRLLIGLASGEPGALTSALLWGFSGALPGFLIGFHVDQDSDQ